MSSVAAYRSCRLRVAAAIEDELVALACDLGALGAWVVEPGSDEVEVEVYFAAAGADQGAALERFVAIAAALGGRLVGAIAELPERDWLEPYRRGAQPLRIGPLLLDPREPGDAAARGDLAGDDPPDDAIVLRLPARRAFGTGSHASTRLVLDEMLELGARLRGTTVLDVGCGTGVLSFAALCLGAARAIAFDCDIEAIGQAAVNRRLNRLAPALYGGSAAALAAPGRFDLVLVNVIPEELRAAEVALARLVREGGVLVASGILEARADAAAERWRDAGLQEVGRRRQDEWTALVLRRPGC